MKRIRPDPARIKRAQLLGERARVESRTRGGQCHVEGCRTLVATRHEAGELCWLTCAEHESLRPDIFE
jgi:hypothetical protein